MRSALWKCENVPSRVLCHFPGGLSREIRLPHHIPTALTANGEAALRVPLRHRGLLVPLLMSACRSFLTAKNKMWNPSTKKKSASNLTWLQVVSTERLYEILSTRSHLSHQLRCSSLSYKHQGGNEDLKKKKVITHWNHHHRRASLHSAQNAMCRRYSLSRFLSWS